MGGGIDEGCNEEGGTFVNFFWSLAFCDLKSHGGKKNAPLSNVMEEKKTLHCTLLLVPLQYYLLRLFRPSPQHTRFLCVEFTKQILLSLLNKQIVLNLPSKVMTSSP